MYLHNVHLLNKWHTKVAFECKSTMIRSRDSKWTWTHNQESYQFFCRRYFCDKSHQTQVWAMSEWHCYISCSRMWTEFFPRNVIPFLCFISQTLKLPLGIHNPSMTQIVKHFRIDMGTALCPPQLSSSSSNHLLKFSISFGIDLSGWKRAWKKNTFCTTSKTRIISCSNSNWDVFSDLSILNVNSNPTKWWLKCYTSQNDSVERISTKMKKRSTLCACVWATMFGWI